ncbi:hypothetical protein J6590_060133 [Homalodisca vitripennis]|nr:hypothetical protein J6590_060133 [Homalodisca vitripennis]
MSSTISCGNNRVGCVLLGRNSRSGWGNFSGYLTSRRGHAKFERLRRPESSTHKPGSPGNTGTKQPLPARDPSIIGAERFGSTWKND